MPINEEKIKSIERLFHNKKIKVEHDLKTCHLHGETEKYMQGQLSIINEVLGHLKAADEPIPAALVDLTKTPGWCYKCQNWYKSCKCVKNSGHLCGDNNPIIT